jgi:predicted TIM-barrel fold metal-dependent hydrolase
MFQNPWLWLVVSAMVPLWGQSLRAQEKLSEPKPATPQVVEDGREGRPLRLELFRPEPTLVVPATAVAQAKFPVIDIHTHFRLKLRTREQLDEFVQVMDRNRIALCVSLDGGLGEPLREHLQFLHQKHAGRFMVFAHIDWQGKGATEKPATWDCNQPDFVRRIVEQLQEAQQLGACGVKVFKSLGLTVKNADGSLASVDDVRWDPIWKKCGELGFPVLIHTADPLAFFQPIDEKNERWEELHRHPDWSFYGPGFPKHADLMAQLMRVVERHPRTNFIAAHLASSAEDLTTVAGWLEKYPNLYLDFASRINELGRQPYTARKFLIKYEDRILFGTDGPWPETRIRLYWRFLETFDENFPYSEKEFPPQGLWRIYGVQLPEATLRKIYADNVLRLMPAMREKYQKAAEKWKSQD